MGQCAVPDRDTEQSLRRMALEVVQRLPLDAAHAERVLAYSHELLANFIVAKGPSPCVGCQSHMLQPKPNAVLKIVPSS